MQQTLQFSGSSWARALLRVFGWRVDFNGLPGPKGVVIAYPHTSNWDFVVSMLAKRSMGVPLKFWAKEGLFRGAARFTLGPIIRSWGAIEIDRSARHGVIEETVKQMQASDFFWLALSPEGTRKYQDHIKTGFYRVALGAGVPVGLGYFDFANKRVGVTEFMMLTGDEAADLARIAAYYQTFTGARPERAGLIKFKALR